MSSLSSGVRLRRPGVRTLPEHGADEHGEGGGAERRLHDLQSGDAVTPEALHVPIVGVEREPGGAGLAACMEGADGRGLAVPGGCRHEREAPLMAVRPEQCTLETCVSPALAAA